MRDRNQGDSYEEDEPYEDDGPSDGPPDGAADRRVTPFGFAATVALAGSLIATLYALFVERTAVQIPVLVSGLAVLGITLLILAVAGATRAISAAEEGRPAAAFFAALLGGLCALAAAGSLGSAVVFALIWGSAR
jgi:hypothetical protein